MENNDSKSVEAIDRQLYVGWRGVTLSKLSDRRRGDFMKYSHFILQRIMRDLERFKSECKDLLSGTPLEGVSAMMALCIVEQQREKILRELCEDFEVQYSLSSYDKPNTKENIEAAFRFEFFLYMESLEAELAEKMRAEIGHEHNLEEMINNGVISTLSDPELN
jgi:hypothetical protein